ncbi:hypothetical protein LOAG_06668 [Loa loa]|uniref:Uncharacterized protein n=1 Tax=Loa loa TaxID=7209 RepID=A0A1S0TXG9_LOALO|nr:hypothetical protein LOAG_06668 [Loa loa]EFO21819.2 hypothetical protein LOAG_06668 [Loa loa]
MKENEQQKKEKEIGINVMDSDRKAVNSIAAPRKSICAGILTKLNKPFQNEEPSGITREQHQCYNGHDEDHNQKHHQQIYDFTGSLKDELSVPAFGTGTNETVLQAVESLIKYPFTVCNTDPPGLCSSFNTINNGNKEEFHCALRINRYFE